MSSDVTFAAAELTATARPITWDRDLFDALGPDGFAWSDDDLGFATSGVAARVAPRAATEALAGITLDDAIPAFARPRAVGALPFVADPDATLTIPEHMLTRGPDGTCWHTAIHPAGSEPTWDSPRDLVVEPSRYTIERDTDPAHWAATIDAALTAIDDDTLTKVVLARDITVRADVPFDGSSILRRLALYHGSYFLYADATGPGVFLGASPELLVARRGTTVTARPMAGTAPVTDDAEHDLAALSTLKHEHEHAVVVDAVVETLQECGVAAAAGTPEIVRLATVAHLATTVSGAITTPTNALDLAVALHPTPAVGGTPRAAALAFLAEHEALDRGRYAGPVGWVNADGDGTFAVALRCAQIDGPIARLFAGAGIVAGSDPHSEWLETQAKLEPMLRALVRP